MAQRRDEGIGGAGPVEQRKAGVEGGVWQGQKGSNLRLSESKSDVLPAELCPCAGRPVSGEAESWPEGRGPVNGGIPMTFPKAATHRTGSANKNFRKGSNRGKNGRHGIVVEHPWRDRISRPAHHLLNERKGSRWNSVPSVIFRG